MREVAEDAFRKNKDAVLKFISTDATIESKSEDDTSLSDTSVKSEETEDEVVED